MTLYTIGHGTKAIGELIEALRSFDVQLVADVRAYPRSRTNPQFNEESLSESLASAGIAYEHVPALGGRRRGRGDASPNASWRHPAFRGYADYMMDDAFWAALDALLAQARHRVTAVLCSETLWWRCHRRMIADAAVARGAQVMHIMRPDHAVTHELPEWALKVGDRISYVTEACEHNDLSSGGAHGVVATRPERLGVNMRELGAEEHDLR